MLSFTTDLHVNRLSSIGWDMTVWW